MLKKNILFNLILSVSQVLFPLIIFPYASRVLEPQGIGSVAFIDSITSIFLLVAYLGIPIYGVREISKVKDSPSKLNDLYGELIIIHFASTLLLGIIYLGSSFVFSALIVHRNLIYIGLCTLIFNVFITEWFFQGIEDFSYITKRTLLIRIVFIVLLYTFVKSKEDTLLYYGLMSLSFLFNALFNYLHARKQVKISFKNINLKRHLKPLLTILGSNLAISIYLLIDTTVLGLLKGEVIVGYYSTAVKITKISITLITALGIVLIPQISKAFSESNFKRVNELIDKSINYTSTLAVPICFGIIITAPFLVDIIVGPKFHESILLIRVLAAITVIIGFTNVFAWQILTPLGKDKIIFTIVTVGMIINLSLNLAIVPFFSALGATIINVFTEAFVMLMTFYNVRKLNIVSINYRYLIDAVIGSLFFIPIKFVFNYFVLNSFLQNILTVLCCAAFYAIYQIFFVKNELITSSLLNVKSKLFASS
ncbi:flippase [Mucilaginibacter sp. PAMB04274]|uniref:flippase n=1 Tax=Mucilaginibacter sp. PAMB04274 TaxID=3138568 RepID=UPI0031F6C9A4